MAGLPSKSKLSAQLERKIDIATALWRERLFEAHLSYAVELIEHAGKSVAPPRAIEIYLRLHQLPPADAENLTHRVLVALGQRDAEGITAGEGSDDAEEGPVWQTVTPAIEWLQRRLRGRVNKELRQWVELHTARTEVALLKIHVANARELIRILEPGASLIASVEMYAEAVHARPALVETIYHLALNAMSEESNIPMLPRPEPDTASQPGIRALPMRIIENTG